MGIRSKPLPTEIVTLHFFPEGCLRPTFSGHNFLGGMLYESVDPVAGGNYQEPHLGTDVVRRLLQMGYKGLICIRPPRSGTRLMSCCPCTEAALVVIPNPRVLRQAPLALVLRHRPEGEFP